MSEERAVRSDSLAVPQALDAVGSGRRFTEAGMRRLRVLFIVSEPTSSPAISVNAMLMRFVESDRVEVHVVYERLADALPTASSVARVIPSTIRRRPMSFGPRGGSPLRALAGAPSAVAELARTVAYARRHRIDVIHCYDGARNGVYGLLLAKLSGAKWIVGFFSQYGDWMSAGSRLTLRRADAVVPVSTWTGRTVQRGGIPCGRILPVLIGIDTDRWRPSDADGSAVRRDLGIAADAPLIVCVAQLVEWKRQKVLLRAFASVVEKRPDARLVLVGTEQRLRTGSSGMTYGEELRGLVSDLGLDESVQFTGFRTDVRDILAAADISTLPSVGDPAALAICEAMAMGKPVVAVEDGGSPELLEHGTSGLLGPADDAQQLAENLLALVEDPALARELGMNARRRALQHLDARRVADEIEAVYRLTAGMPAA